MKKSLIDLVFFSDKRKDLLFLLKKEPRDIDTIKEALNVDSGSIQPHIKRMKESHLIVEKDKVYELSEIGEAIAENVQPLLDMAYVFEENAEYWKNHDLNSIPYFLLERIGEIGSFELLEPDIEHMFETPRVFLENLLNSKNILTFVTYFHPESPYIYTKLVEKGAEITLCMTENVAERLFLTYPEQAKELAKKSRLFILRKPAAIPSVIVTDHFLAFKLFENNGKLRDQIVLSFEEKALAWGRELFQYCVQGAEPLNEENFL
ncbi:MAG: helix-turn-helix transcriptional regulator [Methanosarcina sp.]